MHACVASLRDGERDGDGEMVTQWSDSRNKRIKKTVTMDTLVESCRLLMVVVVEG